MEVNEDFLDFLAALLESDVEFLVVGAYAVAAHGYPRATGDMDIFVRPSGENARRTLAALVAFGAPVSAHGISVDDFANRGNVYQLGLPPRRIDVLTSISGVTFDEAAENATGGHIGPHSVPIIGLAALIRNKRASGRPKDIADALQLEALRGGN